MSHKPNNPFIDDVPDWSADFSNDILNTGSSNIANPASKTVDYDSHAQSLWKQDSLIDRTVLPASSSNDIHISASRAMASKSKDSALLDSSISWHRPLDSLYTHISDNQISDGLPAAFAQTSTYSEKSHSDPLHLQLDHNNLVAQHLSSSRVSFQAHSDVDDGHSDSVELLDKRYNPDTLLNSMGCHATDIHSSNLSLNGSPLSPCDTGHSSTSETRSRASRPRRKREDVFRLPEQEFLDLVLQEENPLLIRELLSQRLTYLSSNNFAEKMANMPAWMVAVSRCPAIIATLSLELIVGAVISSRHELIRSNMMITSFLPVLSSIAGNVGLQASTATLRGLSTGHASASSISSVIRILLKEFYASLVVASFAGISLMIISSSWAHAMNFGIATGLSAISGIMGALGPLTFRALKIDPALMAGPFETAMQDLIGSSVYLGFCAAILG
ncbi:hypothetical protein BATDEDRAFT_89979 [Batrachochytrium dendrobatidis JAM81]|uniref:SLC41A/MgtE integral membrane domain-containing protein n=1 Tax=Batrachochytrium dendrobatidis (strain JAM81 / FGSC 10211) TaxID=684364 RepID=F4P734_BATDJ|nr:uncharacterized protein BATDEDRAFT_89979 [Batrachochytrium dendrobatidis JAM81]EGF78981.1 hypothetical protein BATDEDRAFT_89979 [Batrachochytrium dendrobatidis JAM81]|eukprot:XP_006680528.1 hypothetical protein BATDEDRAFT_89979 [Batrachochytrium dendrobatidis JAM81]